jgi:hypothetical protein
VPDSIERYYIQNVQCKTLLAVFRIRIRKFLGLPDTDQIHHPQVRIQILPSSSKNKKKTHFTILWLLYDGFLSVKDDVNVPSKGNKQKIFCWHIEGH